MPPDLLDTTLEVARLFVLFVVALALPLLLQLWLLFLLSRLFDGLVFRSWLRLWLLFSLIGYPVHEFSHALAALLVLRPVAVIRPLPDERGTAYVVSARSRLFGAFISLAPLIGGLLTLWLTARYIIPPFQAETVAVPMLDLKSASSFPTVLRESMDYVGSFFEKVFASLPHLQWTNWRTYVGLYIAFSVAASLAPSAPDIRNFYRTLPFGLVALLVVFTLLYASGSLEARFPAIQRAVVPHLLALSTAITYAFVLIVLGIVIFLPLRLLRGL